MSLLDRAFTLPEKRSIGTSKMAGGWFPQLLWGSDTKKVPPVSDKTALTLSAVWCAVEMKSDSLAVIPFGVYYRTDTGRERDRKHPAEWLLNHEPDGENGVLTPFHFKKLVGQWLMLRGNCLFAIRTALNGVQNLEFIPWEDVTDIRYSPEAGYTYHIKKGEILLSSEVLHYRGLTMDGVVGLSVLTYAALSMNLGIELQKFSYANAEAKGIARGVLESDNKVDSAAKKLIKDGVSAALAEKDTTRFVVLDGGLKYKPITINPQEAALIESGKLHIEDVARWFNVPLYKLKSLTQSTNNNVEQMALDYQTESIQPPATNFEQETAKKLFTRAEKEAGYFVWGNMDVIVRTELRARAEYYSKMVNSGIMTVNEVRSKENLNANEDGNVLRFPVNVQTQDMIDNKMQNEG